MDTNTLSLFSDRISRIKPSPTLAVSARAAMLKAQGKNIIGLAVGEPDFDTPLHIKDAAIAAIQQGFTKYTAVEGIPELRHAITNKFLRDNQLQYTPKQILVSNGAKQSFYNLAQVLLQKGDEVIIPAPYWVSYPDMVQLADAKPIIIHTGIEQNFKMSPKQLEQTITPKTKLLVLNSPSNPTGMAYCRAEWEALGAVLKKHPHVYIASDDMYEKIYWGKEPFSNILMCCPELYSRTLVVHGVSKTYAMTGWRIGFAAGPEEIIDAMNTLQSQSTSNACSISQKAAVAALEGDQNCIQVMLHAFKERHDYLIEALNQLPGVTCTPNDGTFYAFAKVQALIDKLNAILPENNIRDDIALAEFLLMKAEVAVVPGSAFGTPGYIRLSFATSLGNIKKAIQQIQGALEGVGVT